jgi:serine/threonine protein kinase
LQDADRFLQEARIIGSLSHPNIVLLLEFGFHDGGRIPAESQILRALAERRPQNDALA